MKNNTKNIMLIILVVIFISAVAVVFLIYYQSHKNDISNQNEVITKQIEISNKQGTRIEGKITLEYKIPEFPNVKDDINVLISEKGENEANYFSAVICDKDKDNCIWLISETGNKRIYGYKLSLEGNSDYLRIGEKYKVYVSTRHYNDKGNITGVESDKVTVEISKSGITNQEFNLIIIPL